MPIVDAEIVRENESIARSAYERREYVLCFLLAHSLVESLLRSFLSRTGRESFSELIDLYSKYLKSQGQSNPLFVEELTKFNQRRNRVVHNLWKFGYSRTNEALEPACRAAFIVFGLFIEWIETFDPEITRFGFEYEQ